MKSPRFPTCCICDEAVVVAYATRVLECRHVAHSWCVGSVCFACDPPQSKCARFWLLAYKGVMGEAHAELGQHRKSVMMASTLGFLWISQPFIWLGVPENALHFVMFTWLYRSWIGTAQASCVAMWISGMYGGNGFFMDVATCCASTHAFRFSDASGSAAVFIYAFYLIWRRPSMWDVHVGNCCGAWSAGLAVFFASSMSGIFAASLTRETFSVATPLHAYLICRVLFSPQTKDPFTKTSARRAREVFWFALFVFLLLGQRFVILHNSEQHDEIHEAGVF